MTQEGRIYFENERLRELETLKFPILSPTTVKKSETWLGKELVAQLHFQYLIKARPML
jgi:hypothetical protein